MMNQSSKFKYINWGILILITIIYTLFYNWTPVSLDSLSFVRQYNTMCGVYGFSWEGLVKFYNHLAEVDNRRLPNMIDFIVTVNQFNHLLVALALGIVTSMAFYAVAKLSTLSSCGLGVKKVVPTSTFILISVCCAFFIWWRDSMLFTDYALNYIPSILIWSTLMIQFITNKGGIKSSILLIFLSVLLSQWHEGFAIPAVVTMGFLLLTCKEYRTRPILWISAILTFVGVSYLVFCHGIIDRLHRDSALVLNDYVGLLQIRLWANNFLTLLLIAFLCAQLLYRTGRQRLQSIISNKVLCALFLGLIFALIISSLTRSNPRTSIMAQVYAIVIFGYIFHNYFTLKTILKRCVICFSVLLWAIQCSTALLWSYRLNVQYERLVPELKQATFGTVYEDIYAISDVPFVTLYYPPCMLWYDQWHYYELSYALFKDTRTIAVVPSELQVNLSNNPEVVNIPGDFNTLCRYGNSLIGDYESHEFCESMFCDIYTNDGQVHRAERARVIGFNGLDGHMYVYIHLRNKNIQPKSIVKVTTTLKSRSAFI